MTYSRSSRVQHMATRKQVRQVQSDLRRIGWPISVDGVYGARSKEAVKDFKRGFAFIPFALVRSTTIGPTTRARIRYSAARGGMASRHFTFKECASKGNGWIKVSRALLRGMERYRRKVGHGVDLSMFSVYRDRKHNAEVGGATSSQHLYGNGADLVPELTADQVKSLHCFSGIGIQRASGLVRHVDVRHKGPNNTTGGTPDNPTIWFYG